MRKLFLGMFALLMGATIVSCNQKPEQPANADADSAKVEAAAPAADQAPSLADVVAKMKAEGANWTEDQWKENIGQAMLAMKPVLVKMKEFMSKMESGDTSVAAEFEKFASSPEAVDFEKLADEIDKIVSENPVAKKVNEDKEWQKKFMEENGIPDVDE